MLALNNLFSELVTKRALCTTHGTLFHALTFTVLRKKKHKSHLVLLHIRKKSLMHRKYLKQVPNFAFNFNEGSSVQCGGALIFGSEILGAICKVVEVVASFWACGRNLEVGN